ncbi:MAG: Wzz/FepE/Etk N-terminal domain-containing protein [Gammaproteobacteria bacterium]
MKEDEITAPTAGISRHSEISEVSLSELWMALRRRRTLILAVTGLSLLVGAVLAYFITPLYESRAVIELGAITQDGKVTPIESPPTLVARLRAVYRVDEKSWRHRGRPHLDSVASATDAPDIVEFTARGANPRDTQQLLTEIVGEIVKSDRSIYDTYRADKEQALKATSRAIGVLEQGIVGQTLARPGGGDRSGDPRIEILTRAQALAELQAMTQRRDQLQAALSAVGSWPTSIVVSPTLAPRPSYQVQALLMVLSLVFGLLLGLALTVVGEFRTRMGAGR